jgi:phenol/toluene 2-monooxygenase (NADH) P0/A0
LRANQNGTEVALTKTGPAFDRIGERMGMATTSPESELLSAKFVRVRQVRDNGLVEFDFAIGSPDIFAELIMPQSAFDDFCATNAVIDITGQPLAVLDFDTRLSRVLSGDSR